MKTRKIKVEAKKVDELMALFRAMPDEPIGEHLSDDQLVSYTLEMLTAEQVESLDAHLATCSQCSTEMEQLLETSEAWRGQKGEQRLDALRLHIQAELFDATLSDAMQTGGSPGLPPRKPSLLEQLLEQLGSVVLWSNPLFRARSPAAAEAAAPWEDGQTEDGTLRWRIVNDEEGNRIIRFGSNELTLDGVRWQLFAGDWQREFVWRQVAPDQVGAEIVVTHEEWKSMPRGTEMRVGPVANDIDAPGAIKSE